MQEVAVGTEGLTERPHVCQFGLNPRIREWLGQIACAV